MCEKSQFLYLTCDLPPPPLYPDEQRENIIPQVPIYQVLNKFNGITETEHKTYKDLYMKRYEITKLPPYIILYMKVMYLFLHKILFHRAMKFCSYFPQRFTKNMFLKEKNPTIVNFPVKNIDFGELLLPEIRAKHKGTNYNLIANIVHEGEPGNGIYKCYILHKVKFI